MNKALEAEVAKKDILLKEASSKKSKSPYLRGLTNMEEYNQESTRDQDILRESAN